MHLVTSAWVALARLLLPHLLGTWSADPLHLLGSCSPTCWALGPLTHSSRPALQSASNAFRTVLGCSGPPHELTMSSGMNPSVSSRPQYNRMASHRSIASLPPSFRARFAFVWPRKLSSILAKVISVSTALG